MGATELPKSLSDFDVEQSFRVSTADVAAIRERFRADRRLGVALQLVFLRATGRPLDRTASVPRALLRSLCVALGVAETTIASLKTIYERVATLYEHQQWARDHAGIAPANDAVASELGCALESLATTAASVDELVQEAELWLFGRQRLLPADRSLRDLARKAFASIEAAALDAVNREIPATKQAQVLAAVYSSRRGRIGGTVLEWLKQPAGKHSPTSITEVTEKISYLKELGVDTWSLSSISNARLRAYAQTIANRPPAESRRRVEETQVLETICFLRVTLLELTDTLMYMTGRRVNDLVRHASNRVTAKQARSAVEYRQQTVAVRQIIHDDDRSAEARIAALKELLPKDEKSQPTSHAALVRQSLAEDATRVTALLNSFADLDLKGHADQRPMKQVVALRELIGQGARELPTGFDADIAGPVWHELLNDEDRTKALAALKAATMLSIIGHVQFGDIIVETDACTGFSEILLGRRAKNTQELVACYAALLAHGTENDAKGVAAMIPGIEVAHISAAMRSLEARDRLRKASERVVEFQRKNPIAELWGSGDKASADMMALDASRHLYNARVDPRRRTFAVGLYTHVLESYGVIYDQPIVHNERQSSAALEGVEQYNARNEESMRLSLLAVDTHGYRVILPGRPRCRVVHGGGRASLATNARPTRWATRVLRHSVPRAISGLKFAAQFASNLGRIANERSQTEGRERPVHGGAF
ncbi:MAG: Tn3 family transposase [Proteobacteria bacterium]|nr:Tn3 family transposase [Pseudomonadota bacterium]